MTFRFPENGLCSWLGPKIKVICVIPGKRWRVSIPSPGQVPQIIKFWKRKHVLWFLRRTRQVRKVAGTVNTSTWEMQRYVSWAGSPSSARSPAHEKLSGMSIRNQANPRAWQPRLLTRSASASHFPLQGAVKSFLLWISFYFTLW